MHTLILTPPPLYPVMSSSTDAAQAQMAANLAQAQAMAAKQQEEEARRRKAEELKRALEEAPKLDVPWQLLEASASKARIRALAKTLDPTMELDDGAVQVRGCFPSPFFPFYRADPFL